MRAYHPEHLHCTCEECGYEWLMECADAEKAKSGEDALPKPSHEIVCPACDAVLVILSEHSEPVHVAYCKPKEDYDPTEGCTCGASVGSPVWLHSFDCPMYQPRQEARE